jgi:hypothetical protein
VEIIKKVYCLFIIVILTSCGGKEEKKVSSDVMKAEVVNDTSNVMKLESEEKSNSVSEKDSLKFVSLTIDKKLSFAEKVNKFIEKYELMYSKVEVNKPIIPERYESKFSKKIALKKNSMVKYGKIEGVYPVAQLWFYEYADSTSCRNVLNNWLQCYGFDCTPVEFMKDLTAIKTTPSFAIINEKEIVFLQYQCEHIGNNWADIRKELENVFGKKTYYTISLENCGKKLVWKKVE